MYPKLGTFPTYYAMWLAGDAVCLMLAAHMARQEGTSVRRMILAVLLALTLLGIGSKLFYLVESYVLPNDDYVPAALRGPIHGFRIPGGIILVAACLPLLHRVLGSDSPRITNRLLTLIAAFIVFVRLGCFLNGCCFGSLSSSPFAMSFPAGSWAHFYHLERGWISPGARTSLAVHPLQLYFAAAGLAMVLILLGMRRSQLHLEDSTVAFFGLFVASSFMLEFLRANRLHLNLVVLGSLTLVFALGAHRSSRGRLTGAGLEP